MFQNVFTLKNLGWLLTAVVAYMLGMAGISKVMNAEQMVQVFTLLNLNDYMVYVGIAEIVAVLLLVYPRTSIFGALACSTIMSAAIGQHLSCLGGQGIINPIVIGLLAWSAHCLRSYTK
jgi:uncharacterized membrane protein YphA (DoxX/SURF4 family)